MPDESEKLDSEKQEPETEPRQPPRVLSQELFQGNAEILIEHKGETYRLRKTRNGKLILHK